MEEKIVSDSAYSFSSWVNANQGRFFSKLDYLHAVYNISELHPDFVRCFAELIWPEFKKIGNRIFVLDIFDTKRYQEYLAEGRGEGEVQAWLNLVEITGIFENIETESALIIAEIIVRAWNAKIKLDFCDTAALARVIYEKEEDEVYVTIGSFDASQG